MSENVLSVLGRRQTDRSGTDALACLETWIERVRSGEISSVAVAGIGPGRSEFGHSSFIDGNLVGAVAILQHDLCTKLRED